jgi:hypothetical protein
MKQSILALEHGLPQNFTNLYFELFSGIATSALSRGSAVSVSKLPQPAGKEH